MVTSWIVAILLACAIAFVAVRSFIGRRRRGLRLEYQRLLHQSLDDGVLSEDELAELDAVRRRGALTPEEVRMAALAIYRGALRDAAADARLTPDEDATLRRLQEQLHLTEDDLGADYGRLSRLRMLARIAERNMPDVQCPVPLVPDERCHWVVQCTLADRIPVPHSSRSEPVGSSFAVLGTEPFSATGGLDALRPADDVLPSDVGVLIITSRRTIFHGARRTVSVPHARAEHVTLFADGLRLEEIAHSMRRYFLVEDPVLTCAILLQAARTRRNEIRPRTTGRSA